MSDTSLRFSVAEFQARLERVRELMKTLGIDLLVLDDIEAMSYASGYGVSETLWRACAVPLAAQPFLLVRSLDVAPARERCWFSEIVGFKDWEDPERVFVSELERRGLAHRRIGIDYNSQSMSIARFERFRTLLSGANVVDFGNHISTLRLRKSPAEIDYLRKAAGIADTAMLNAVKAVRVGGTQRDVATAAAATYLEMGADDGLVGPLTSGNDWDSLHGHLHSHPLEPGAIVHIELVPRVSDYSSRIMRSAIVGKATPEQHNVARLLIDLQDRQIAAIRPGAVAREIDAIVRNGILEQRLRPSYDNITGYNLGAYPYPTQRISDFNRIFTPEASWVIEPGMVFHMYTSARGLAFSETVLVHERGADRLTQTARRLFEAE